MNVLGVIARVRDEHAAQVATALRAIAGVEVRATSPRGRMVLVIEDTPDQTAAAAMAQVALQPHVLSTALVYEYAGADAPADGFDGYRAWRMSTHDLARFGSPVAPSPASAPATDTPPAGAA